MTLVKRGVLAGMQVYVSVPWAKKPLTIRNPPPWTGKAENLSGPQLRAVYALAKAAHDFAYGKSGKLPIRGVAMPIGAYIVQQAVPRGPKAHGGRTAKERAELRHAAAAATLTYLEELMKEKGVTTPSVSLPEKVKELLGIK